MARCLRSRHLSTAEYLTTIGVALAANVASGIFKNEGFAMSTTRYRNLPAALGPVLAVLFGLLFWGSVAYAVLPMGWITWPKARACAAAAIPARPSISVMPPTMADPGLVGRVLINRLG